jgi:hypothetical protein
MNDQKPFSRAEQAPEINVQQAWLIYCKTYGMDSMNRNTYAIFKAGWDGAMQRARRIVYQGEEWKLMDMEDMA